MQGVDVVVLLAVALLLWHRALHRRRVRRFVRSLGPLPCKRRDAAIQLTRACFQLPKNGNDPHYLATLPVIGASPADVVAGGGCCSGLSRLLILALAEAGTRAFQVTLYHREGHAQHCLVQAWLGEEPLLIDPTYGVVLCGPRGGPLGLADLQAGVLPHIQRLPDVTGAGYPDEPYYDFDYSLTQTANWTRSPPRRLLRATLGVILGNRRAARLEVPAVLEWPQHLAALAAVGALAATHVLVYMLQ